MFKNFEMLDGIALCADDQDYEWTYLDRIKINDVAPFDAKPSHIGKLFEREDEFLQ
jgi:hypothetical protein